MFPTIMNSQDKSKKSILFGKKTQVEQTFLHRLVEEEIVKNQVAEKTALIYEDDGVPLRLTKYSALNQNANQIAQVIFNTVNTNSLRPNKEGDWVVAVCMKHSDSLVTTLYAVWKAGASYLPIDVLFPENRIDHILKEAKPCLVIYDDSYPHAKYFNSTKSISFGELKQLSQQMPTDNIPDDQMLTKGDSNTKAVMLYTSGSTGTPKCVRLRHFTFIHRILWQLNTYPYGATEKHCVFKTALTFVDHIAELWCPIIAGKSVVIIPKTVLVNPELFVPILENYQIVRLLGVPTLLRSVLMYLNMLESNKTKFMLSNLKIWYSSGETLTVQIAKDFFDYFDNGKHVLVNLYGCTEVSCDVVWSELQSKEQFESLERIPLGSPLPNMIVYILDKDNKTVPEGEVGEICCAGVNVTDGYINGQNSEAFVQNPFESDDTYSRMYKTGDYGSIEKGLIYYEGRRDTQIKIRGHRIDISEVEKNVNELKYVAKSAILVYHASLVDQALVAFIVTKNANPKTPAEIENDLKSRLTPYMIPQVLVIEEFPYLLNGKTDRQALLKMYEKTAGKNNGENKMELSFHDVKREKLAIVKEVFEIIGTALGSQLRGKVSVDSNFFELGGNSLNTVYTVTQLRDRGFYIGLTDFMKAQNLGEILDKITTKKTRPSELNIITDMILITEPLCDDDECDKESCLDLIANCFFKKADLDQFLTNLKIEHYKEILGAMWSDLVRQGLSFKVKNEKGEIVGVDLSLDVMDEPEIEVNNVLTTVFEFLESVEKPIIENRIKPAKGEVVHNLMQATSTNLSAKDNIGIMGFMEAESMKLAESKGFKGVFTTNTNPLTQQFGESFFGYETLSEVQINQYKDKLGYQPFKNAPDHYKVVVMYKLLK